MKMKIKNALNKIFDDRKKIENDIDLSPEKKSMKLASLEFQSRELEIESLSDESKKKVIKLGKEINDTAARSLSEVFKKIKQKL